MEVKTKCQCGKVVKFGPRSSLKKCSGCGRDVKARTQRWEPWLEAGRPVEIRRVAGERSWSSWVKTEKRSGDHYDQTRCHQETRHRVRVDWRLPETGLFGSMEVEGEPTLQKVRAQVEERFMTELRRARDSDPSYELSC